MFGVPLNPNEKLKESVKRVAADASVYLAVFLWMQKSSNAKTKLLGAIAEVSVLTGFRIETLLNVSRNDFTRVNGTDQFMSVTKWEPKQGRKILFTRLVPTTLYKYFEGLDANFKLNYYNAREFAEEIRSFIRQKPVEFPHEL